jgi:hypothetical protein
MFRAAYLTYFSTICYTDYYGLVPSETRLYPIPEEKSMKKALFIVLLAFAAVGLLFSQWRGQGYGPNRGYTAQSQTVTGTLALRDGTIAVVSGNQVYYTPGLGRFVGFIEDLKEGAQVRIDGYVWNNGAAPYLEPSRLTVNGKNYDLQTNTFANTPRQGYGRQGNWGRGGCCW